MLRYLLNVYHGRLAAKYGALALANVDDFNTWRGYSRAASRHAARIR